MSDSGADNLIWAAHLVDALVAAGVGRAVISPGSRSTSLALAWERHPKARTFVQVDERCAAFFALGLARAQQQPVALVCTSGSAPGHWLPAVIEANHSLTPLILLSADRPRELQECGANQTIDQARLFGSHVRASHQAGPAEPAPERLRQLRWLARRAVDQSRWPLPGPVHLNLPLREPLVPAQWPVDLPRDGAGIPVAYPLLHPAPGAAADIARLVSGESGIIVCGPLETGPDFADALSRLARALNCPVLADPLSGLRFGAHDRSRILTHYDGFLRSPRPTLKPQWVLRFGAMPVSKFLQQFLARLEVPHVLVESHGRWPDATHSTSQLVRADPGALCRELLAAPLRPGPDTGFAAFADAERQASEALETNLGAADLNEGDVIRALFQRLADGATLFAGNSMVIRDVDTFAAGNSNQIRLMGSRGASGIDGNVSTVMGIAAAGGGPVVGLLGDLALYHDLNGLLAGREVSALLVVLNNGGGGIFGHLPQAGLPEFERNWLTPVNLDLEKAAALFDLAYLRAATRTEAEAALDVLLKASGTRLLEVVIDREASVARHRAYWAALA